MTNDYVQDSKVFKAFADENRLKVLELLKNGEKCACTLQEELPIGQSTLSHHMKILVESGVVSVRKDKKWSYYALSDEGVARTTARLSTLLTKTYEELERCHCESDCD